ncbi:DeoR/GlpR family DNA-binding transcription regulator [Streptococcus sp. zg-JUN1979]|uniref:DeoR/GlpR family DNA-binding transcription regulator n=1 Tax=Streptococcus sp. zg-JUN1979 TaxID=3391450 RepID=UPI0039A55C4B
MNKAQRLEAITKLVHQKGTIRVSDIMEMFQVTDMTVRRDFAELEEKGVLTKIHGGARSNNAFQYQEYSHKEKHTYHIKEKQEIAKLAADLIEEGDTIFLGPGTTVECLVGEIRTKHLTVITNCLPVFQLLLQKQSDSFRVFLLGGEMRQVTESFVGEITNSILETMHFNKMFFSSNGVKDNEVMTSTVAEAYTQKLAFAHSLERYLLLDSSKVGKSDFASLCQLSQLTAVLTDSVSQEALKQLAKYVEVIA